MKDNKKNIALIIAKKMNGDMEPAPESENGNEQDHSIAYKSASEEIMKAVESKSPEALTEALKSFIEMCLSDKEGEPEQSEYPEESKE